MNGATFVWRWIPPGRFLMGSPEGEEGRDAAEGPQHSVAITRGFWIAETPVTQEQWGALRKENPSRFRGAQRPVERVTWDECQGFAKDLGKQITNLWPALPTDAQWEYACRAGSSGPYHSPGRGRSSGKLKEVGWYNKNSEGESHELKGKKANAWGLYDMHGNVYEWCSDGLRKYAKRGERDPMGPEKEGVGRVIRGGSWDGSARFCRAAYRYGLEPGDRWFNVGFRLCAGQEPRSGASE